MKTNFDLAKMEKGVRLFLEGCGIDPEDPLFVETPSRVARAWAEDLLDGYGKGMRAALGEPYPAAVPTADEMIVVRSIDFHSICPHHLLPYKGLAHVAYLNGGRIVGLSRLAKLVDVLSHRLVLQELLSRQIADALCTELGSKGAAVVLDAEHSCVTLRGEKRRSARAITEAFAGAFAEQAELRERFLSRTRS